MANDGTVKIGTDIDEKGFKSGLSKLGNIAKTGLKATGAAIAGVATAATGAVAGLLALESATEEYRIAQGKLNTAFEAAGFGPKAATQSYEEFYKILGDTDTATEASQLLAKLAENEEDISTWTNIAAGVYGTFGDALPIEGLIEAANETAKVGQVTGTLADALNWAGISEDEFNEKLASLSSESERNRLIMDTLAGTYDEASEAFYRNNEALIQARENQVLLDDTMAQLGETVSKVKNNLLSEFLPGISSVVVAFNDLINGVDGADEALSVAIQDMVAALVEKLPEFLSFGVNIIQSLLEGLLQSLPALLDGLVEVVIQIGEALIELAPMLLDAGLELLWYIANGIEKGLPALVAKLPEIINAITTYITDALPTILAFGVEILTSLANGIINAIPVLLEALPEIITNFVDFIAENLPEIANAGIDLVVALISGIIGAIPNIIAALPKLLDAILSVLGKLPEMMFDIGAAIVQGLIDGIFSLVVSLGDAVGNVVDMIFGTAQEKAEVHSPSKRAEWLGAMIDEGLANGLTDNTGEIKSAIRNMDIMGELERAMPNVEHQISIANAAMTPAAAYNNPPVPQNNEVISGNGSENVLANQNVVIRFEGELAQFAQIITPYIDSEHERLGTEIE